MVDVFSQRSSQRCLTQILHKFLALATMGTVLRHKMKSVYLETTPEVSGRRGGLMVSALDSGSGGPGSSPGRGTALCSLARYFTLIMPLSTQVYRWVPANLLLGVTL